MVTAPLEVLSTRSRRKHIRQYGRIFFGFFLCRVNGERCWSCGLVEPHLIPCLLSHAGRRAGERERKAFQEKAGSKGKAARKFSFPSAYILHKPCRKRSSSPLPRVISRGRGAGAGTPARAGEPDRFLLRMGGMTGVYSGEGKTPHGDRRRTKSLQPPLDNRGDSYKKKEPAMDSTPERKYNYIHLYCREKIFAGRISETGFPGNCGAESG